MTTTLASAKPLSPADVVVKVDGQEVARTTVKRTVPAAFSASETFDVGVDLGSPVSLDYFDRRPFAFNGKSRRSKSDSSDRRQFSQKNGSEKGDTSIGFSRWLLSLINAG